VTFGEPALRLLAMGCAIFAGFYLLRSSPVGPLGLLIGLAISYALALVDSNASPEKLTRELLWIWVVISYPIALLVVSDLALGRSPEELFRRGISARLRAAGAFLAGDPDDDARARREIERFERMGTGDISPYANDGPGAARGTRLRLLAQVDLLLLLVRELPPAAKRSPALARALVAAGEACRAASDAVLAGRRVLPGSFLPSWQHELARRTDLPADVLAVALPLLSCVTEIGSCLVEPHDEPSAAPSPKPRAEAANAATSHHTEAVQFALKVTLASMTAYILYTSLDWWGIHTAMLTCFLVAQESAGATIHKLTLRIIGALIGAALGIASIVFVLPHLETVGGLAVLVAAVTLLAAWIATARETISYAGWQIAFAFYLCVLQGFSRTSKMVVGRDRVIGILVGNLIMSVVFTTLWPDRIKTVLREALGRAVQSLADALRLPSNRTVEAQLAFRAELQKVKQSGLQATLEPGAGDLSPSVAAVESLFVPIHALIQQPLDSHLVSQDDAAALRAAGETAAKRLSDLAAAIPELRPIPPFQAPAMLPAVDGDPRVRLQAKWFELLEDRISDLSAETRRAAVAEGTP
jgi:multidrug resistance protein MdtO